MSVQITASDLTMTFGGIRALDGVGLQLEAGEMVGLIGPNGSGKTTLLNVLSGVYRPSAGRVVYLGQRIDGRAPARLARLGIARSFQITKVFKRLTVLENLLVPGLTDWAAGWEDGERRARAILADLRLDRLAGEPAGNLSGGQAKLLEFGRMMMLDPRLVLLDEPFGGVNPDLKRFMHDRLEAWNATGVTILLVSHDMGSIFGLCRRVVVLHNGRLIADGLAEDVRTDRAVLQSYLGENG